MADDNILASNLAQLGGQIAATFQNVALQNQYKNSLPAMQQIFKQSMTDFDSGRSGAGFARIMDVAMQNPNNPYIQNMAQMAFRAGQLASDDYFKRQQIDISRSKAAGTSRGLTQEDIDAYMNFGKVQGTGQGATQGQGTAQGQGAVTTQGDTELGTQIVETPWLSELGLNIGAVQGPAKYKVKVDKGTTETMGLNRLGATRSKSQTTGVEEINTKEEEAFNNAIRTSREAASLIKSNKQLNSIWNSSNKDLNNIKLDEIGNDKTGFTYIATVYDNKGNQIGKPESLTKDEYNALNSLKQIPDYVSNSGGSIKLIPSNKERFPVREQVPTQPAEQPTGQPTEQPVVAPAQPATQVSAPSKPTEFSNQQNPFFEAAQRSQVSSATKGGGRAGRTGEGRAKQIQAEIDSIDERIKTIEKRRGSPQDKYRAFEMLSAEKKKLQSELSKFSK